MVNIRILSLISQESADNDSKLGLQYGFDYFVFNIVIIMKLLPLGAISCSFYRYLVSKEFCVLEITQSFVSSKNNKDMLK